MSKVDELIQELCPDGVERVAFGEVIVKLRTGLNPRQNFKLNTPDAQNHYVTVRELNGFSIQPTAKTDLVNDAGLKLIQKRSALEIGDVLFSGTGTIGKTALVSEVPDNWGIKEGVYAITPDHSRLNPRFLIHLFHSSQVSGALIGSAMGGTVTSVSMAKLKSLAIPLPPLEIQEEIVRTLDQFVELDRELEQEIAGRVVQFNRVRENLLSDTSFPRIPVGNLATRVSTGATPKASESRYYQGGDIPWLRTGEVNFGEIWETEKLITKTALDATNVSWIAENCVIVAISGATAGRVAVNKIPMTTNQHCCNMQIDPETADYRFVFHALASSYEELKAQGRGARGDLNTSLIKGFPIPLPPLEVQEEIAAKLDTFTEYIDNLKRERELRQKQYEYYRDQLLDFDVKE